MNFTAAKDPTADYKTPEYAKPDTYSEKEVKVGTGEWELPATLTLASLAFSVLPARADIVVDVVLRDRDGV